MTNNLSDFDISVALYIDGESISSTYFQAERQGEIQGIRNSDTTILPFKFQELELVGAFHVHFLDNMFVPHILLKTQTWKMPTSRQKWGRLKFGSFAARPRTLDNISHVLQTDCIKEVYRSAARRQGGIMSGTPPPKGPKPPVRFSSTPSTADAVPSYRPNSVIDFDRIDPIDAPCASVKVFYRPRGGYFMPLLQTRLT